MKTPGKIPQPTPTLDDSTWARDSGIRDVLRAWRLRVPSTEVLQEDGPVHERWALNDLNVPWEPAGMCSHLVLSAEEYYLLERSSKSFSRPISLQPQDNNTATSQEPKRHHHYWKNTWRPHGRRVEHQCYHHRGKSHLRFAVANKGRCRPVCHCYSISKVARSKRYPSHG